MLLVLLINPSYKNLPSQENFPSHYTEALFSQNRSKLTKIVLEGDFFISGLDLNFMGSAVGIIIIKIGHCGLALLI